MEEVGEVPSPRRRELDGWSFSGRLPWGNTWMPIVHLALKVGGECQTLSCTQLGSLTGRQ